MSDWKVRFVVQLGAGKESEFILKVHPSWAPLGAQRFRDLVEDNYFAGCRVYRVIPDFISQFGIPSDPSNWLKWGENKIKDDPSGVQGNRRGYLSFATSGPDKRGSQIFINLVDNFGLDSQGFAPFAEVISGMKECVDNLYAGYTIENKKPDQMAAKQHGNEYFEAEYPLLSYIVRTEIL